MSENAHGLVGIPAHEQGSRACLYGCGRFQLGARPLPSPLTRASASALVSPVPRSADGADSITSLTSQHVGLVHHVARQLSRRLHDKVDLDELVSAGSIGLLQAAASYEPARGLPFSPYAVPRIRGSMLDELRRHDHMSRGARRKARAISTARESLTRQLGREPKAAELAAELNLSPSTLREWEGEVEGAGEISLDVAPRSIGGVGQLTAAGAIPDERTPAIDERIGYEE